MSLVLDGGRLEIPSRERLPGADTPTFHGLDDYIALMTTCWAGNPDDRPTFEQIVAQLRWALRLGLPQNWARNFWWTLTFSLRCELCPASLAAALWLRSAPQGQALARRSVAEATYLELPA